MDVNGYAQNVGTKSGELVTLLDDLPKYSSELKNEFGVNFPQILRDMKSTLLKVHEIIFDGILTENVMDEHQSTIKSIILTILEKGPSDSARLLDKLSAQLGDISPTDFDLALDELLSEGSITESEVRPGVFSIAKGE